MKKHDILGLILVATALVSLIPFVSVAQPKQQANGILINDPGEVFVPVKQKAIADCGFNRPMRVASFVSNPPFGWVELQQGTVGKEYVGHGYSIELFDRIAKNLDIQYVSTGFTSYQKAVNALKKGELDLLIGVYTPGSIGRGSRPIYPSYFKNIFAVYYPNDRAFGAYSFASLEGKRGIVRREENIYPLFAGQIHAGLNLSVVNTAKRAFEMLMNGEADYLIGSPYSIEAELRRYKLHEDIVPADWVALDANLFFVLTTNTDCYKLRDIISEEIAKETEDERKVRADLTSFIDAWGERFREDEALKFDEDSD